MKTSDNGIEFIKREEGCVLQAYHLNQERYWTIGVGHYGSDVKPGMKITQQQADELLRKDLKSAEDSVSKYADQYKFSQNKFDALVSFTFNCGANTLADLMQHGSIEKISEAIPDYNHSCGKELSVLTRRRYREKELFDKEISMKITAQQAIDTMRSWIGLSRAAGTHHPLIDMYNAHKPLARGYKVSYTDSFCDVTLSDVFIKNNATEMIGGTECGVEEHIKLFKAAGIWHEDGSIVPKPGYIICYNWDDNSQPNDGPADHIGLVIQTNDKIRKFDTAEGNIKGMVGFRRSIPYGWGPIRGYAIPDYAAASEQYDHSVGWHTDDIGKWYATGTNTGEYFANGWHVIDRHWYFFNSDGYVLTGMQMINGKMYYLQADGELKGACWHESSNNDGSLEIWTI